MGDLLITVAPTGAETSQGPTARSCPPRWPRNWSRPRSAASAAGAAMVHVHVRDGEHRPTLDPQRLRDTVARAAGGHRPRRPALHRRLGPRPARGPPQGARRSRPTPAASLIGTTNFGDAVFLNPRPFVCDLYQLSQERQIVPEFELFDLGQVAASAPPAGQVRAAPTAARCTQISSWACPAGCPGQPMRSVAAVAALPLETTSWSAHRHRPLDPSRGAGLPFQGRAPARRHGGRADPGRGGSPSSTTSSW